MNLNHKLHIKFIHCLDWSKIEKKKNEK